VVQLAVGADLGVTQQELRRLGDQRVIGPQERDVVGLQVLAPDPAAELGPAGERLGVVARLARVARGVAGSGAEIPARAVEPHRLGQADALGTRELLPRPRLGRRQVAPVHPEERRVELGMPELMLAARSMRRFHNQ